MTTKLYRILAIVCGSVGVGMFLGHSLGEGTSNTPLWLSGLMILLGAVLLGMSVSTPSVKVDKQDSKVEE